MSKAERTRQFIIEKTAAVFNTKGYAGTSMNDLTEATGLTKGSIYGNFKNKDEVALAVFEYNSSEMQLLFSREIGRKATWRDKLLTYPEIYASNLTSEKLEGGCPILNTAIEADDTHPDLRMAAGKALIAWKNSIAAIIRAGITAGEFQPDTEAETVAVNLLASIEGMVMMSRLTGQSSLRKLVLDEIRRKILEL